jgi:hypothetical protein
MAHGRYRWLRQGAVLSCVIAVYMMTPVFAGNTVANDSSFNFYPVSCPMVAMAEPCAPSFTEAIQIFNFTPDVQILTVPACNVLNVFQQDRRTSFAHYRSWREDVTSFEWLRDSSVPFSGVTRCKTTKSSEFGRWQTSSISDAGIADYSLPIGECVNAVWFGNDIGALKDSGIFNLASGDTSKNDCKSSNENRCDGENFVVKERNFVPNQNDLVIKPSRSAEEKIQHGNALLAIFGFFCLGTLFIFWWLR